eukprot:GHVH01001882.1.p1 GENE.GHVH01001882.1~~GHVH01001882.1.p1  ORF type:complete len:1002 (+),score=147.64 GHVH01001882.1:1207-4212(+)
MLSVSGTAGHYHAGVRKLPDKSSPLKVNTGIFCPYYAAMEHAPDAAFIFLPYTYLIDPQLRRAMKLCDVLENSIVVVDEGHNLESSAETAFSVDIHQNDFSSVQIAISWCVRMLDEEANSGVTQCLVTQKKTKYGHPKSSVDHIKENESPDSENNDLERMLMVSSLLKLENIMKAMEEFILETSQDQHSSLEGDEFYLKLHTQGRVITDVNDLFSGRGSGSFAQSADSAGDYVGLLLRRFVEACHCAVRADHPPFESQLIESSVNRISTFVEIILSDSFKLFHSDFKLKIEPYHAQPADDRKPKILLKLWCLCAASAIHELYSNKLSSLIVMSGTLKPMDVLEKTLGRGSIMFQEKLENSHVIKPRDQIFIKLISTPPRIAASTLSSVRFLGSYNYLQKYRTEYYQSIGSTVSEVLARLPCGSGSIIFFNSKAALKDAINIWIGSTKVFQEIKESGYKIFTEKGDPPFSSDAHRLISVHDKSDVLIAEYRAHVDKCAHIEICRRAYSSGFQFLNMSKETPSYKPHAWRGGLLLAVVRGSASEGIDFADHHTRAVICVGVPYPNMSDDKVKSKKEHLDRTGGGGDEWYQSQAIRAVNQCVGRCIRHINDYGIAILLDCRYNDQRSLTSKLSPWIQESIRHAGEDWLADLVSFFNSIAATPLAVQADRRICKNVASHEFGLADPKYSAKVDAADPNSQEVLKILEMFSRFKVELQNLIVEQPRLSPIDSSTTQQSNVQRKAMTMPLKRGQLPEINSERRDLLEEKKKNERKLTSSKRINEAPLSNPLKRKPPISGFGRGRFIPQAKKHAAVGLLNRRDTAQSLGCFTSQSMSVAVEKTQIGEDTLKPKLTFVEKLSQMSGLRPMDAQVYVRLVEVLRKSPPDLKITVDDPHFEVLSKLILGILFGISQNTPLTLDQLKEISWAKMRSDTAWMKPDLCLMRCKEVMGDLFRLGVRSLQHNSVTHCPQLVAKILSDVFADRSHQSSLKLVEMYYSRMMFAKSGNP